ncbi:MAG: peptide chain release factor N(5)-glutamine methyltransferase [bacterium JZ-2024 1]
MKVADALRRTQEKLVGYADLPSYEAEFLVSVALQTDRARLLARLREPLDEKARTALEHLIEARKGGTPLSLLRGWKRFRELTLFVAPGVFIPRYETETLVDVALEHCRTGYALDLGTGAGALAMALAKEGAYHAVYATDISEGALALARRNALYNNVTGILFFRGDLFQALPESTPQFDVIVSNPPYIPRGDLAGLPRSVRDFEPVEALDGGPDGLSIVARIITEAPAFLRAGGALILEIAPFQVASVSRLLEASQFLDVRAFHDGSGLLRCVRGVWHAPRKA